jgi:TIR domain-containing protein
VKTPCIFISYRRSDAEGWAGRLSDSLRAQLGHVRIFRDIEEIPPGVDFVEYFTRAVGECDAFIEIIGPGWLTATDAKGQRRLDDPDDLTRLEVATALRRNIRVIPTLLEGASMPTAEDLPPDLQGLARRNAYPLSDSRWTEDTRKLADILREIVQPPRQIARTLVPGGIGVVVLGIIGIVLMLHNQTQRTDNSKIVTESAEPRVQQPSTHQVRKQQPNIAHEVSRPEVQKPRGPQGQPNKQPPDISKEAPAPTERDLINSIRKATGPSQRITLLNSWNEKYPDSEFKDSRLYQIVQTYGELGKYKDALEAGMGLLAGRSEGSVRKQFKDRGEYDLANSALRATDAHQSLTFLMTWKERYPDSDYKDTRLRSLLATYAKLGRYQDAVNELLSAVGPPPR